MLASKVLRGAARKLERRPAEAPKSLSDIVLTLAEAMRFGYAETLGKWHLLDLPRAILYSITDRVLTFPFNDVAVSDCIQLKDPEMLKDLYELKKCLTRTMLFSKKRFRAFLSVAGFTMEDVLKRKRRARILKPAFTVIRDRESKCLLVFIRGTRSLKDTLTDAIGAPVSFKHFICSDGVLKRSNMVSGHGHRGMVAAARWIKERCTHKLLDALRENPGFQIKVVGHSLGGGTAALLTFMLREIKQFSSCTCVTFGPGIFCLTIVIFAAACMSFELAEFGKPFITSIINGYDMVPTLSASSVHDFIVEVLKLVTKIALTNGRIKRKKFITAIGSHIPFASSAKAIADRTISRGTQVLMKHKQRTRSLLSWSRHENNVLSSSKSDNLAEASRPTNTNYEVVEEIIISEHTSDEDGSKSSSDGSDLDDEEEQIISAAQKITTPTISDDELLNQFKDLELETQDDIPSVHAKEKEEAMTKDNDQFVHIEESVGVVPTSSDNSGTHPLYPPGRIMHIIPASSLANSNSNHHDLEKHVYLYETSRQLYGKLRLSRGMILDHMTSKYLKVLQQLINQLEKEKLQYDG
uniref:Sn1-specific diacylglycerol lipase alpha n=1 Tax=Cajanus cajan TaxID=3821 RepID=A0A151THE2_CAJCA|nr:Sn1-specific diacylglycerol lipase alpha [Cajanus cajan]